MMRPRAYKAAPSESTPYMNAAKSNNRTKTDTENLKENVESFEEDELSHHKIVLKLLAKLQNEQKNPTLLKVE